MIYFDSAYIARCYLPEWGHPEVVALASRSPGIASAEIARIEVASVFHRKLREAAITAAVHRELCRQFDEDIQTGTWILFPLNPALLSRAQAAYQTLPSTLFLRSADCLHLCAAADADEICQDVPHRHLVLTLPRMLRGVFQREPALLGELYHATHEVLTLWLRDRAACPTGQPGLVVAVQTFGDYLLWHPHVHVLATAGVFTADATFHLADTGGWETLREFWRHALLRRLREARALAPDTLARLLQWRHSGFGADGGEAPLANDDAPGRRRLAEYLLRAPYSLEKITYHPESGTVLYRSERHWRTRRNFEVFSALNFIRALLGQVPAPGGPQVRYYGYYSNKSRGLRSASLCANLPSEISQPKSGGDRANPRPPPSPTPSLARPHPRSVGSRSPALPALPRATPPRCRS